MPAVINWKKIIPESVFSSPNFKMGVIFSSTFLTPSFNFSLASFKASRNGNKRKHIIIIKKIVNYFIIYSNTSITIY